MANLFEFIENGASVFPPVQDRKTKDHRSEFQPLDEYTNIYRQRHAENVSNFFEDLVVKSDVDQEENRLTVRKINKLQEELNAEKKSLRKAYLQQAGLIFAIVICVVLAIGAVSLIANPNISTSWNCSHQSVVMISVLVILLVVSGAIAAVWIIVKKIVPRIKELKYAIAHLEEHRDSLIALATEQMKPLNGIFERYMSSRLMEKTYPLIKLDDYFDIKRYDCLSRKYGLWDNQDANCSTLFIQSGEINGNPFCFFTNLMHSLGTKTYSGHLTVHWTETEHYTDTDGKRKTRTVQKSETLHASVTKPCPYYNTEILLVYGNEAAPNLCFSREDTDAEYWNEKQTEREVGRRIKRINSQMRKAVTEGKTFTSMGNEFDALFGATNRNNEVEFRVLFTPIAQREMLKLIKDKTVSWGDDFNFCKSKMLNYIGSDHLIGYDMSGDPVNYRHYDIDTIRKKFRDYNNEYFRAVYFAFAPLLAIPLYQQHKPHEFIYRDVYRERFSCFAHEFAVNRMLPSQFAHPQSRTQNILKTRFHSDGTDGDLVNVTAHGYETANRRDHVNVHCFGNNRTYSVPVDWIEYLPVQRTTSLTITEQNFR